MAPPYEKPALVKVSAGGTGLRRAGVCRLHGVRVELVRYLSMIMMCWNIC